MADTYDFPEHTKGDTFSGVLFEVRLNDEVTDLTGYTIRMHLRKKVNDPSPTLIYSTTDDSIDMANAAVGKFLLKQKIVDVPAAQYVYDIEFSKGGVIKTWIKGRWKIVPDVTW